MKYLDTATYDMIIAANKGEFPGGEQLFLGVGIPIENPNLNADAKSAVAEVLEMINDGDIVVAGEVGNLFP